MNSRKPLPKISFGMGDRFGFEGRAQLSAVVAARAAGVEVCPVWNKSNREHSIIGTEPMSLREEADEAVAVLNWKDPYFVDADHIDLETVERFAAASDFFTLDVADQVGHRADTTDVESFLAATRKYAGELPLGDGGPPILLTEEDLQGAAAKFLRAIQAAGAIYRKIAELKGGEPFATEISIDETDAAQSPGELFCILSMIAAQGIPAQTVAPKFKGRFNKGVDYVGELARFEREFVEDLRVLRFAREEFGLPEELKLSVHSGSDKFSLYPIINRAIKRQGSGLHVKTAGTTWLEEVIGLAEAGGEGLDLAKLIYRESHGRLEELIAPYKTVVDIDPSKLPPPDDVEAWNSEEFANALRHDPKNPAYNLHMRQLLHVGFKVAAGLGETFRAALRDHREVISRNVTGNLLDRHILPLFG